MISLALVLLQSQVTPESVATRVVSLSPAAYKTIDLLDPVSLKEKMTSREVDEAVQRIDQAYAAYPITWSMWLEQKMLMLLREDETKALTVARTLLKRGNVTLQWLKDDSQFSPYLKSPEWAKVFADFEKAAAKKWAELQPEAVGLTPHYVRNKVIARDYWQKDAYPTLADWNDYPQPKKTGRWCLMSYKDENGSAPYLIYIPKGYSSKRKTPALLYFYGGWMGSEYSRKWSSLEFLFDNPYFAPKNTLDATGTICIMPMLNKRLNPSSSPGVQAIRAILAEAKMCLNIDDNRVAISGFSDGGTTCYEMARKDATDYSSIYALNGWPGFQLNMRNIGTGRPVHGYFAEKDDLYAASSYAKYFSIYKEFAPNWKAIFVKNGQHLSMFYGDSLIPEIVADLTIARRNPFPEKVQLEARAGDIARLDWLEITGIDPKAAPAPWHKEITIQGRTSKDGELKTFITNEGNGMIQASRSGNVFAIQTSRIKSFRLYLPPGVADLSKKVQVVVNGVEKFNDIVKPDNSFMIQQFMLYGDRTNLPKAKLDISLE